MAYLFGLHIHYSHRALTEVQSRHHRILDALFILLRRLQTIDNKLDKMWLITVQSCNFIKLANLSIDTDLGISTLAHLLQKLLIMSLTAPHQR